ncbi:MAG: acetyl-CoA carboxylase, carboxyltransferase subunit beta [Pleomorphochaeta sp.]
MQCPNCHEEYKDKTISENLSVCPSCNYHFRMKCADRIKLICDENTFEEIDGDLISSNPLEIEGYEEKLKSHKSKSNLNDAVVTGKAKINNEEAYLCLMCFDFMGGSMGALVGEKITKIMIEGALNNTPVIIFSASGGARMQEGIFSLMQMAKTSAAVALMNKCQVPLFVVLTHPTTGGVSASFAMLGDVILSEPGALIGFAGPRVIQGTIGEKLPKGFQTAEFQKEHGFVDSIVERKKIKETLSFLIKTHKVN